jgi:hypothetical protein
LIPLDALFVEWSEVIYLQRSGSGNGAYHNAIRNPQKDANRLTGMLICNVARDSCAVAIGVAQVEINNRCLMNQ